VVQHYIIHHKKCTFNRLQNWQCNWSHRYRVYPRNGLCVRKSIPVPKPRIGQTGVVVVVVAGVAFVNTPTWECDTTVESPAYIRTWIVLFLC
jgi:hypothetical protein